jgi:SprT-like family protein
VLQTIRGWIARGRFTPDPAQLPLGLDMTPRDADELLVALRARGMKRIDRCALTKNSRVMVSFRGDELRIHEGYLAAPPEVLDAIVRLVEGRTRAARRAAGKLIVANSVAADDLSRRHERTHPDDATWSARLVTEHTRLNAEHFANALTPIDVRVSRRMKTRLGHYSVAAGTRPAEIAISRRHIRRHGWGDAIATLLHEMVHQWQAETGAPLDHGPGFRTKALEVGIRPRAKRDVE